MKKPEVGLQQAPDGTRFLTVKCPDCEKTTRYKLSGLQPGTTLECPCGVGFNFTQKNYDDLKEHYGLGEAQEGIN